MFVKTSVVLVTGWLLGACAVVAMDRDMWVRPDEPQAASATADPTEVIPDLVLPVAGVSTGELKDTFDGPRSRGRLHHAIDILAPRGTPVLAAVDGTIRKLFTSAAGGLTIYEFDESQTHVYYYAHLQRYRAGLEQGMSVHRGDIIGFVGTSGNAPANAPHLHFAIGRLLPDRKWWKAVAIDPYPLLLKSVSVPAEREASRGQ